MGNQVPRMEIGDFYSRVSISAEVLHDRPPPMFHRRSVAEQHELFARLAQNNPKVSLPMEGIAVSSSQTLFTEIKEGLY